MTRVHLVWGLALAVLPACRVEWGNPAGLAATTPGQAQKVLVYTSMYRPMVEALEAGLKQDLPDVQVTFFQGGSEKVASRIDAEMAAGACPADLLATSDPAYAVRLKQEGRLTPHVPPGALRVPRVLLDPDGAFTTQRVSTMVLAHHAQDPSPPKAMADLWSPPWQDEVILGDPLSSGTFFTTLALLEKVHGQDLFDRLRAAGVVATGSSNTVAEKLANKERRAGMLLLENALMSQAAGQPLAWRVPTDGVVLIPGVLALLKTAPHPDAARRVMDWMMEEKAQHIVVDVGLMHAAREGLPPPKGAPGLETLLPNAVALTPETWVGLSSQAAQIKTRFGHAYGR